MKENINKLFYIFVITVLLFVINILVVELNNQSLSLDESIQAQNKITTIYHKVCNKISQERNDYVNLFSLEHEKYLTLTVDYHVLESKKGELQHDVDSMLEENQGLKHDYIHLAVENIALKKALTNEQESFIIGE